MKIIVCNIGSSSLKFQLLDMETEQPVSRGTIDRIGGDRSEVFFQAEGGLIREKIRPVQNHRESVEQALDFLTAGQNPVVRLEEIGAVGFKCVQAGEKNGTVFLDAEVLEAMERYRDLAPAHNPPYLEAIRMFRNLLPETPLVGVFEPGFHTRVPDYATIYGTPYDWYQKGVRRYGYHGASHRYIAGETVRHLGLPPDSHRIISCHLGGSSSICAVRNGASIDVSMGFSPQSGLIQGTRTGDLDPYVLPFIMSRKGISLEEALRECSRDGGLAGISGTSGDMRDILEQIRRGSNRARLARDKFIYDIKRYIGSYLTVLEGLDALTFTGGIGQRDSDLRIRVLQSLSFLGLVPDREANERHATVISQPDSPISALVLETNEEIVVARETVRLIRESAG